MKNIKFFAVGLFFGIVLVRSQVISWFRIQEMFRFQSFHMYGIIGSAIVTGMLSIRIIRWLKLKTITGEAITIPDKTFQWGNVYGGLIFGLGWAITGACPGPLFAQLGSGYAIVAVTLLSAIAGTWLYGLIKDKLPH